MYYNNKIESLSQMRVLAMIMILLFHSLLFYTGTWWKLGGTIIPVWVKTSRFLDSIDLSLFVFVSGYLYGYLYIFHSKYRNRKQFVVNKFKRLLIPYLVWGCLMVLARPSLNAWPSLLTGISHLWFLLMLFEVFIMASCLIRYKKSANHTTTFMFVIIVLYLIWGLLHKYSPHHSFLCIETSISYLIPFLLGYYCVERKILERSFYYPKLLFIILLFVLATYFYYIEEFNFYIEDIFIRLVSYTTIILLFIILDKTNFPKILKTYVEQLDSLSFGIYIFNQMTINELLLIPSMNKWFIIHYKIGPLLIFFISFFIPLLLSFLFQKSKWLSWMIGNK
jgi:surface polysaccharide O-acyltransferase-like enzyme